jgi:hypothetical protein
MKRFFIFYIFCLSLSFSCSKKDESSTKKYLVTVNNGSSSGEFSTSDSVFIWSNPPSNTQIFDKWAGDTDVLYSPYEWKSKVKSINRNLTFTATFKTIGSNSLTFETINGSNVYYYIPSSYRGIIFPFHGAGGNAASWAGTSFNNYNFVKYAIGNDYAVIITESKDRISKTWDITGNNTNIDIQNIDAIINNLSQRNIINASKPKFSVGMSQGSGFASVIALARSYKASALFCEKGIDAVMNQTTIPTIWNMAPNDVAEQPTRLMDAFNNYNKLIQRNIPAQFMVNTYSPVNLKYFEYTSIPLSSATSIIQNLKNVGWLSSKGYVRYNPRADTSWISVANVNYNYLTDLSDILFVCYGEHKFFMDLNYRTITFFNLF